MAFKEHQLPVEEGLLAELEKVYGQRLDAVVDSFGRMGSRFYFRLNTLKGNRESLMRVVRQDGLAKTSTHENILDAAFVPTNETSLEGTGLGVEADRFAAEAVLHGAHLYAPGVRKCQGLRAGVETSVVSQDGQVAGNGIARQGEQMILKYRSGLAVEITENRFGIPSLMDKTSYQEGQFHPQSLPAMVTCHVLNPHAGETIVDLNCAPGGKLSYICQLTNNGAQVVGFDRNVQKLEKTRRHLDRLGCANYQLVVHDSRYVHQDFTFKVDKVLVDPPCTGLGVVPKLSVDMTGEDIRNLSDYQRQFLTAAAHVVRSGGEIVYSVCTVTWEECEGILDHAVQLGLALDDASPMIGGKGLDERGMTQRFDPDLHGTGYFIAKFLKP